MKEILRQTSYVFFVQVLTRIIGFFYTIFLASSLGVLDFGIFSVGLAYFSIISAISDFGFNRYLIREIARGEKVPALVSNITILRLTSSCVLFALFSVILYLIDPDKLRVSIVLLATLAIIPQSIALTFDGIFVALRKLQFSSVSLFISSVSTVLMGYSLIKGGFGVFGAVDALIFGQLSFALVLTILIFKTKTSIFSHVKFETIKNVILGSLPYGLLGILGLLYFRVDTILLSYLRGNFETGLYGVSYRFLEAVTFIPSAFFSALFPVMADIHKSPERVQKLYMKSLKVLGGLGIIVFLLYLTVLPSLITIFLPSYSSSITVISILSLAIPFMFLQAGTISVLLSTQEYLKPVLMLSFLTVLFNIGANLVFIPFFGVIAASWITVVSEVISFTIFFVFTKFMLSKNR